MFCYLTNSYTCLIAISYITSFVIFCSLNKLAELENRITSLEIDNVYDKMKEDEVASQQQQLRTALEFKKKMANDPLKPGSVRTVYSINQKRIPLMKSNQRSNMSYNNNNKRGRGGKKVGNTFITANEQQPNDADQRRFVTVLYGIVWYCIDCCANMTH